MTIQWQPQPKQAIALASTEDEILFGGARGGGMPDTGHAWLLYDIDKPSYRALVIRKNYTDLSDWLDRAQRFYFNAGGKLVGDTFIFPSACNSVGVIGDIHIPYQDNDAIEAAFAEMEAQKIESLFINGDMLDFYQLSFHEKDPRNVHFKQEIEAGRQFLEYCRYRFPDIPIYFIPGNHENRFERYLRVKASELLDMDEFRLDVLLHVAEYGVQFIPFRSKVVFGDFLIEHGDKIPGAGGVVPARTALMRLKTNCLINHFHKTSDSSQRVYGPDDSTTIRGYSLGCLCELTPEYLEINEWNHGFAILKRNGNLVQVNNYEIEGNQIV